MEVAGTRPPAPGEHEQGGLAFPGRQAGQDDPRPVDEACTCECCSGGYSRAYLRHLYVAGEILSLRLLSLHNLHWYGELVAGARAAIERGGYAAWATEVLSGMDAETG